MILNVDETQNKLAETLRDFYSGDVHTSSLFTPTLAAAKEQLNSFNPKGYNRTRNSIDGNVSRLNPYITWGVFTLAEVQRHAKGRSQGKDYQKFVSELGWKAYFREGFLALGDRVYESLEPYKYPTQKRDELPADIERGETGLSCIDRIVHELKDTGYLHNHQRLWFAAYVTHFANAHWWHGERLFYRYLVDGEPGPNALSWQWVASTFSSKPYYFNGENMRQNGHEPCEDAPFNDSYEALDERFFSGYGKGGFEKRPKEQPQTVMSVPHPDLLRPAGERPLVLLHAERLSAGARVLEVVDAPVLVYLDAERFKREQPSFMRLHFAVSLAADLVKRLRGEGREAELMFGSAQEVREYARERGCESLAAPGSWHPGTWRMFEKLNADLPVSALEDEPFARVEASLRSFSSYWKRAEKQVMRR